MKRPIVRSALMGLAALALYGGWALWANHGHGWWSAWRAAMTQGFASFTVTFCSTAIMEGLHRCLPTPRTQFFGVAAGAIAISAVYTVALHVWMGTPEVTRTVLPVLTLGGLYSIVYSANLVRESLAEGRSSAAD